jgi:DNA (cytosine-5)-methyltransferase 1
MTFGSLFAGIGGLDLGLERAGMECKWQVEIDEYSRRVLAKHWPTVRRWDDIKTFPPNASPQRLSCAGCEAQPKSEVEQFGNGNPEAWAVDLICGGFPCQDISTAGKRAGLHGDRSGLFFEAIRVVELLRPRWLLLENVAALLNGGLDEVLATLAAIGFDAEWHCLQAADFGAPHLRDRVFVIAERATPGTVTDADEQSLERRGDVKKSDRERSKKEKLVGGSLQENRILPNAPRIEREPRPRRRRIRQSDTADLAEWWATEPGVGRVANGVSGRVHRLRGLGNAVVPQVAEWLGRQIMEAENETPKQ